MSEDLERILRNSLDSVDRGRRLATLGVAALFGATVILVFAALHTGFVAGPGADKVVFLALAAQLLFIACCTAIVMFHTTRMTKAVLRAIELIRPR